MKKILIIISALFSVLLFLTSSTYVLAGPDIGLDAGGLGTSIAKNSGYEAVTGTTLSENVGKLIKVVLSLVGTVFLALTIYAGILWMTAGGNEENVTTAKKIISSASIGLIITIAGYGLTVFVLLAITAGSTPTDPTAIGGAGLNATGFWSSFGPKFKSNWQSIVLP